MEDHTSEGTAAIFLDYGADAGDCAESDFKICDRGICFKSRWQFSTGTQLAIVVSCPQSSGPGERLDAEATVAACEPSGPGCYQVTALFVDLAESKKKELRKMGETLESRPLLTSRTDW